MRFTLIYYLRAEIKMKADATIFDTDDLSEPYYSGQVVATSLRFSGFIYRGVTKTNLLPNPHFNRRRIFKRITPNGDKNIIWVDNNNIFYSFSELLDIVIINKGVKEL